MAKLVGIPSKPFPAWKDPLADQQSRPSERIKERHSSDQICENSPMNMELFMSVEPAMLRSRTTLNGSIETFAILKAQPKPTTKYLQNIWERQSETISVRETKSLHQMVQMVRHHLKIGRIESNLEKLASVGDYDPTTN